MSELAATFEQSLFARARPFGRRACLDRLSDFCCARANHPYARSSTHRFGAGAPLWRCITRVVPKGTQSRRTTPDGTDPPPLEHRSIRNDLPHACTTPA